MFVKSDRFKKNIKPERNSQGLSTESFADLFKRDMTIFPKNQSGEIDYFSNKIFHMIKKN